MKKIILICTSFALICLTSCSDEDVVNPSENNCFLHSVTDSANYYFTIKYDNGSVVKIDNYKIIEDGEKQLTSSTHINRDFFGEINSIVYYNKDNVFEGVDSAFTNNNGFVYELIGYNDKGERTEKTSYSFNSDDLVVEKRIFKFENNWVLKNSTEYEYDSDGRVSKSTYNLITKTGTNVDVTTYTYDLMKNIDALADPLTIFKKNNILTSKTEYTLGNGTKVTETKLYEYTYNDEGYPIVTKITTPNNPDDVKYKYNFIECK